MSDVICHSLASHDEHNVVYAQSLSSFEQHIAGRGLKVRGMTPNDGNCYFWGLSDQLDLHNINRLTHHQLRQQLVNFVENLPQVSGSSCLKSRRVFFLQ